MKTAGKSTAELVKLRESICADPANREQGRGLFLYTRSARKKLDEIDRAIAHNTRMSRIARGEKPNDAGYSGRQTNRR